MDIQYGVKLRVAYDFTLLAPNFSCFLPSSFPSINHLLIHTKSLNDSHVLGTRLGTLRLKPKVAHRFWHTMEEGSRWDKF